MMFQAKDRNVSPTCLLKVTGLNSERQFGSQFFFYDSKEKHWQVWALMGNPLQFHQAVYTILNYIRSMIQTWS